MWRMVIADDEWFIRESLHRGIDWNELHIHVVGVASDGLEALEVIKNERPHLLLTDIRMPGIDGLELIQQAKEMAPHLRTVIISGFEEFTYAQKALKIGADDYILKPIEEEDLVLIVKRLIDEWEKEKVEMLTQHLFLGHVIDLTLFAKQYAFICWESSVPVQIPIMPGVSCLVHQECEGILFIEEAEKKKEYVRQLDEFFKNHQIVGGRSILSEEPTDFQHLYKQALMIKNQYKSNQQKGLFSESPSPINMEEVIQYIKDHYQESISLQDLAAQFFISDSYFSRIFKEHTGQNFIEYVTEHRITVAKDLLKYTSLKTNEVSSYVGYTDQRYFSQIFKKYTGMTPTAYKKTC
ncbi:response regulator [Bacillus sp. FJAT-50079]|uniref:response regulator transcription factor n=1 Tax=Bacillus sp. FJAT-50079 TaxID=2833577 RepID=UPI001BC90886|nr:response regulator [Bacillus sp. FJAT-50079]MBS4209360.1 response regulator [Bacillus sp. FJAT-50079]